MNDETTNQPLPPPPPPTPPPPRSSHRSYYTVPLDDDVEAAVDNARWGLEFTPYLKLKVDGDLRRAVGIFRALRDAGLLQLGDDDDDDDEGGEGKGTRSRRHVCIDANAAWTSRLARDALGPDALGPYLPCVAVLEQPFPVDLPWRNDTLLTPPVDYSSPKVTDENEKEREESEEDADDVEGWAAVAAAWRAAGVMVIADESVRGARDVASVARLAVAHGVNLKMEKAGGVRGKGRLS